MITEIEDKIKTTMVNDYINGMALTTALYFYTENGIDYYFNGKQYDILLKNKLRNDRINDILNIRNDFSYVDVIKSFNNILIKSGSTLCSIEYIRFIDIIKSGDVDKLEEFKRNSINNYKNNN